MSQCDAENVFSVLIKYVLHSMEQALFEMKKRNEELMRSNKDAIDSPTTPKYYTTNDQVMHLKDALKRREAAHNERIVEMVSIPFKITCNNAHHTHTCIYRAHS